MSMTDRLNEAPAWQRYLVVAVLLGGAAVALGWRLWPSDSGAKVVETRGETVFMCKDCGHSFEPTDSQMRNDPNFQLRPARASIMTCPSCGKAAAREAERCPECDTVFFAVYDSLEPSDKNRCPQCGWSRLEEMREQMETR